MTFDEFQKLNTEEQLQVSFGQLAAVLHSYGPLAESDLEQLSYAEEEESSTQGPEMRSRQKTASSRGRFYKVKTPGRRKLASRLRAKKKA